MVSRAMSSPTCGLIRMPESNGDKQFISVKLRVVSNPPDTVLPMAAPPAVWMPTSPIEGMKLKSLK